MGIVRGKIATGIGVLFLLLVVCFLLGISVGTERIAFGTVLRIILGEVFGLHHLSSDIGLGRRIIVLDLRLPIVIMAALVGMGLAGSGAAMQGLFRNPLVDPYIIGISAGGAGGYVLGEVLVKSTDITGGRLIVPSLSFVGGLLAVSTAYLIARTGNRLSISNMLLAGIAISAALTSGTYLLIYFFVENPSEMIFSLMGTCGNTTWSEVYVVAPLIIIGSSFICFFGRDLNAFSSGEEGAKHLGVDVETTKFLILSASSLVAAISIPFCGVIGFVGLIIPHLIRRVIGPDHRVLLPSSILLGGSFLIVCDLASRSLTAVVIPLGIITGLVGGGFFIYLLVLRRGYS